jgi:hypothetical protein
MQRRPACCHGCLLAGLFGVRQNGSCLRSRAGGVASDAETARESPDASSGPGLPAGRCRVRQECGFRPGYSRPKATFLLASGPGGRVRRGLAEAWVAGVPHEWRGRERSPARTPRLAAAKPPRWPWPQPFDPGACAQPGLQWSAGEHRDEGRPGAAGVRRRVERRRRSSVAVDGEPSRAASGAWFMLACPGGRVRGFCFLTG